MKILLIFCIVGGLVYILYTKGFMFFESKTALVFRGIQKKGCFGAKFKKCNGITKKVITLKEKQQFTYISELDKGGVYAIVNARDKSAEYRFDDITPAHAILPGRYTITTYFDSASGSYMLKWHPIGEEI